MSCVTRLLKEFDFLDEATADRLVKELEVLQAERAEAATSYGYLRKEGMENFSRTVKVSVKNQLEDTQKMYSAMKHVFQDGFRGDRVEGLQSLLTGTGANVKGSTFNVEGLATNEYVDLSNWFMGELRKDNLITVLQDPNKQKEIFMEVYNRTEPGIYKKNSDPDIVKIGDMVTKLNNRMLSRRQTAGSTIEGTKGYVFKRMYDADKIYTDKQKFVETMSEWVEPWKGATNDDVVAFLNDFADKLGGSDFEGSTWSWGARKIVFKDAESAFNANKEWGYGDLASGFVAGITSHSKSMALESVFGSDPVKNISKLKEAIKKVDPKAQFKIKQATSTDSVTDALNYFLGNGRVKGNGIGQKTYEGIMVAKSLMALKSLGGAAFSAAKDLSSSVMQLNTYYGTNPIEDTANLMFAWLKTLEPGKANEVAEALSVSMPQLLHEPFEGLSGRYEPGRLSKAVNIFMTVNGTTPLTRSNRAAASMVNQWYFTKALDNPATKGKKLFKAIGLDDTDVANLQKIHKDSGEPHFLPSILREYVGDLDNKGMDSQKYLLELHQKVGSFFSKSTADEASPLPGARENIIMQRHRQQDDPFRIAGELLGHWKGTLLKSGRGMAKMLRSNDPQGRLVSGSNIGHLATYSLYAATTGYMIDALREYVTKGKEPEFNEKSLLKAFINSGAGGVYLDALLGEYHEYGRSMPEAVAGPLLSMTGDAMKIRDVEQLFKFGKRNMPLRNLWLYQAFNAHILEESYYKTPRKKKKSSRRRLY